MAKLALDELLFSWCAIYGWTLILIILFGNAIAFYTNGHLSGWHFPITHIFLITPLVAHMWYRKIFK